MIESLYYPLRKWRMRKSVKAVEGFYHVKIINRSRNVIWLAKDTSGDLHDIISSGQTLDIRLPEKQFIKFYAYKASDNLAVTGLDYYDKREFTREEVWVIH